MKKLTEMDKLKYWVDAEFSITHVMFAIILLQLTEGWLPTLLIGVYIFYSILYILVRIAYIAADDPNYLKAPKR